MADGKHMAKNGPQAQQSPQDPKPTQEDVRKRGLAKMAMAIAANIAVTLASAVLLIMGLAPFPDNPILGAAAGRIAASVVILLVLVLLGGRSWMGISGKGLAYTFRRAWPLLLVGIVPSVSTFYQALTGSGLPEGFFSSLAVTALLCIAIGVMEEYLFRGIQLNALLAGLGGWRWGVIVSVVISAIMFGRTHVAQESVTGNVAAMQAALKIVQTAMFGVVLSETVMHTRELGSAAVFHALNDFIMMSASVALQGNQTIGSSYINVNQASNVYLAYGIMIAVYLLPTILAFLTIWKEHQTCRGAFME